LLQNGILHFTFKLSQSSEEKRTFLKGPWHLKGCSVRWRHRYFVDIIILLLLLKSGMLVAKNLRE